MKVVDTFPALQNLFNPGAAAGLNKSIQLHVTGSDAGDYAIHIHDQKCELVPPASVKPDLTLSVSDQDWIAVTQGQLDPMKAFLSGKIKATGDMMLAMKIPALFKLQ
ncbi:SCP2 sterol-binding domain-containing protein [Dictyobacter arantiisoli]|uniref:Sterol-binding protein n=1 Tax=Dictyobacter arantiisoli TaxID=2014874 RepID=A0A5A5TAL6_9CHLR|nr:SCP2 sterol-binding domain-containing protein [Dictyobacter arantiisoli]GCF08053.1 sterol-binding protein [Dictyobacter arantiisoli]